MKRVIPGRGGGTKTDARSLGGYVSLSGERIQLAVCFFLCFTLFHFPVLASVLFRVWLPPFLLCVFVFDRLSASPRPSLHRLPSLTLTRFGHVLMVPALLLSANKSLIRFILCSFVPLILLFSGFLLSMFHESVESLPTELHNDQNFAASGSISTLDFAINPLEIQSGVNSVT